MRPSSILPLSSPSSARTSGGARGYASPQRVARMGTSPRNDIAPRPPPQSAGSNSSNGSEYPTPRRHDPSTGGGSILPVLTSPAQVQVPPLRTPSPNAFKRTVWTTPRGPHEPPNVTGSSSSAYSLRTPLRRHSRSYEDDEELPYGLEDDNGNGGYPYYANDGDSYIFSPDQLASAERADLPSSSSPSLLQSRQQGRCGENPENKPKYDDAAQLAYMEQMYNTIQVLNAELEKERQDRAKLQTSSSIDDEITAALEYPHLGGGDSGHPYAASDYYDDPGMNMLVESTPSTASEARRSRPLPSQQPKRPAPAQQNKPLSKDQVELCATLGKNAELRIRTKEMEKSAEKTSVQLDQAQKQMKMVERRISNREEKLRILMKEKLHWQKELKDMRDLVVEEKMRQVELFRRLETAKREGAAQMEQLEHDLRDVHDENQNLRAQIAEARAHITFQAKKIDDVVRQARDEKEKLVLCIAETRYKFKEWKEGEAAALRSSREQAVNNVKTEYDLKIARHQEEKQKLREKVKDLEVSLRLMQKDRTLSPLELSLRKATILGSKENAGTNEAELIEAHSRIRELEALMEHSQEYQKRQENIIKVSEATISRLVQEREVTALENLSSQPLAGGFMGSNLMFANEHMGNNTFASSMPTYSAVSSPNVSAYCDAPKRQNYGNVKSSPNYESESTTSYAKPRATSSNNRIQPALSSPLLDSQYRSEIGSVVVQPPASASASASSFSLMASSPSKLSKASPAVETTPCPVEKESEKKSFGPQRQDTGIHLASTRPKLISPESIHEEADDERATPLPDDAALVVQGAQDRRDDSSTTTPAVPGPVVSLKEQFLADEVARLKMELVELKANAVSNKNESKATPTMSDTMDTTHVQPVEPVSTYHSGVSNEGVGAHDKAADVKLQPVSSGESTLEPDVIAEESEDELGSEDDRKSAHEKTIVRELLISGSKEKEDDNKDQQQKQLEDSVKAQDSVIGRDENKSEVSVDEAESKSLADTRASEVKDQDATIQDRGDEEKDSKVRTPQAVDAAAETPSEAMLINEVEPISVPKATPSTISDSWEDKPLDSRADASATTTTKQLHQAEERPETVAIDSTLRSEVTATEEHEALNSSSAVPAAEEVVGIIVLAKSNREAPVEATSVNAVDEPPANESKMAILGSTRGEHPDTKAVCDEKGEGEATVMTDECCNAACSSGEGGECKIVDAKADRVELVEEFKNMEEKDARDEKETRLDDEKTQQLLDDDADLQIQHDGDAKSHCDTLEREEMKERFTSEDQAVAEEKESKSRSTDDVEVLKDLATSKLNDAAEEVDNEAQTSSVCSESKESEEKGDISGVDGGSDEKANDAATAGATVETTAQSDLATEIVTPAQLTDAQNESEVAQGPEEMSEEAGGKTTTHALPPRDTSECEATIGSGRPSDGSSDEDAKAVLTGASKAEAPQESIAAVTIPAQPADAQKEDSRFVSRIEGETVQAGVAVSASVRSEQVESFVAVAADRSIDGASVDEKATETSTDATEAVTEPELVTEDAPLPAQLDDTKDTNKVLPEPEVSYVDFVGAAAVPLADQLPNLTLVIITTALDALSVIDPPQNSVNASSVPETDCDAVCDPALAWSEEQEDGTSLRVEQSDDGINTLFFNDGELCDCEAEVQQEQPTPADQPSENEKASAVGVVASNMVAQVVRKGLHHSIVLHLEHRKYVAKTFVLNVLKGALRSVAVQLVEPREFPERPSDEDAVESTSLETLPINDCERTDALDDFAQAYEREAVQANLATEQLDAVEDEPILAADSIQATPVGSDVGCEQRDSSSEIFESAVPSIKGETPAAPIADDDCINVAGGLLLPGAVDDGDKQYSDRPDQPLVSSQDDTESTVPLQPENRDTKEDPMAPSSTWCTSIKTAGSAVLTDSDGHKSIANADDDDALAFCSLEVSTFAKNFVLAVQHEAIASVLSNLCHEDFVEESKEPEATVENTAESDMLVQEATSALSTSEPDPSAEQQSALDQTPEHQVNIEDTGSDLSPQTDTLVINHDAEHLEQPTKCDTAASSLAESPDSPADRHEFSAVVFVAAAQVEAIASVLTKSNDMEPVSSPAGRSEFSAMEFVAAVQVDAMASAMTKSIGVESSNLPAERHEFSAVEFVAAAQREAITSVLTKSMEMAQKSKAESHDGHQFVKVPVEGGEVLENCRTEEASSTFKDGELATDVPSESPVVASPDVIQTNESPAVVYDTVNKTELEPSDSTTPTPSPASSEQSARKGVEPCEPPTAPDQVDALDNEIVEVADELWYITGDANVESASNLPELASKPSADEEVGIESGNIATGLAELREIDDEAVDAKHVTIDPTPMVAEAEACRVVDVAQASRQLSLDVTAAALEAYSAACSSSEAATIAAGEVGGFFDRALDATVPVACEDNSPSTDDVDKAEATEAPVSTAIGIETEHEAEPVDEALDHRPAEPTTQSDPDHASADLKTEEHEEREEARLLSVNSVPSYTSVGLQNSPHEEICNDESAIHETLEVVADRLVVVLISRANTHNDAFREDVSTISAETVGIRSEEESEVKTVDETKLTSHGSEDSQAKPDRTPATEVESVDTVAAPDFVSSTAQNPEVKEPATTTQDEELRETSTAPTTCADAKHEASDPVLMEESQALDTGLPEDVPAATSLVVGDLDSQPSEPSQPSEKVAAISATEGVVDGTQSESTEVKAGAKDLERTLVAQAPGGTVKKTKSEVTDEARNEASSVSESPAEEVEPDAGSTLSEESGAAESNPEQEDQFPAAETDTTKRPAESALGGEQSAPVPERSSENEPQTDLVAVGAGVSVHGSSSDAEFASAPVNEAQATKTQEVVSSVFDTGDKSSEAEPQSEVIEVEEANSSRAVDPSETGAPPVDPENSIKDLPSRMVDSDTVASSSEDARPEVSAPALKIASSIAPNEANPEPGTANFNVESEAFSAATASASGALNEQIAQLTDSNGATDNPVDAAAGDDGKANETLAADVNIVDQAPAADVLAALSTTLDEAERSATTAGAPVIEKSDRFGSRVTWSLPPEAERERPAPTPKSRRTERRRTSRRQLDQARYASMEKMRDPTLAAYDAHREQGQPFAMLDDAIFSIDPNARHMQHDENDKVKGTESEIIRAKRKNVDQDNHRKSIAFRSIPAFNYAPLLIRFQWSDFVIATPISVCNPASPGDKNAWSPVKKMRLIAKKGIKLSCGSYVIISAFIRPLEDGNENLRIHIYDSEWVEEFQYDFFEDHLRAYMHEWSGRDDEVKFFMTQLEFRREEGGIIIKLPNKVGQETEDEEDKRPATAPAVAMTLPDGKEHPHHHHHDHTSPQSAHRSSRHSHRPLPSPHDQFLPILSLPNLSDSSLRETTHTHTSDDSHAATDGATV